MAKIKVRARPGALGELLKKKGMTQVDAAKASRLDRKTLARIERGDEVKLETLQNLATRLNVPNSHFLPPALTAKPTTPEGVHYIDPFAGHVTTLRTFDIEQLSHLLKSAKQIRWRLNVAVVGETARGLLEELETAVQQFHQHLRIEPHELNNEEIYSLSFQLSNLKKGEVVASRLKGLTEHGLTVLGTDYTFWEQISELHYDEYYGFFLVEYESTRIALLSVEPHGSQSHRVAVDLGVEPPKFSPREQPGITRAVVFVDRVPLEPEPPGDMDDEIPF